MSAIQIKNFGGLVPRIDPKELPDNAAQVARNVKLWNGILKALKAPDLVTALTKSGTIQAIYRQAYGGSDYWLHWAADVDVVRGPPAGDAQDLLYFTGAGEPRVCTAEMATQKTDTIAGSDNWPSGYGEAVSTDYPRAFYTLGLPAPLNAPTIGTPSGGSGSTVARGYVYTLVDAWGQESAPSPAAYGTGLDDDTWPLTGLDTAPLNTGSISGATHSGGLVTVTTSAAHWLRKGHSITIASVTGMTDLNGDWTVYDAPSSTTFRVSLTTAQSYSSGGSWAREAPYNVTGMTKRIYRVLSGINGEDYKYVDEIAAATTSYNDLSADDDLGETLATSDPAIALSAWDMPPGDLIGIVSMGSFLAGFSPATNEVCFSEPNAFYAWPQRYRQKADWPIVGLGVWGQNLTVCTEAYPYRVVGFHPEAMSLTRAERAFPCVAKRSIVSDSGFGTLYASDRGLVADSPQGVVLVTDQFYDRDAWQDGVDSANGFAIEYDGRYQLFWPIDAYEGGAIIFDPASRLGAISTNSFVMNGAWLDPGTGIAYIVDSDGVKRWDYDDAHTQTYEWKSKNFVLPMPVTFKAAKVICDFTQSAAEAAAIAAENATTVTANEALIATIPTGVDKVDPLGGAMGAAGMAELAVADDTLGDLLSTEIQAVQFEIYGDGALVYSVAVSDNNPFRVAAGKAYDQLEVRLSGNVPVQSVELAPTMSELAER